MKQRTLFSLIAVSAGLFAQSPAIAQLKPATSVSAPVSKPKLVNSIVVVVNDEVITRQELNEQISALEKRLKAQGTQPPNRAELEKQLVERMILDRAQIQLAKENGMRVDDLTLDRTLVKMAEQNKCRCRKCVIRSSVKVRHTQNSAKKSAMKL